MDTSSILAIAGSVALILLGVAILFAALHKGKALCSACRHNVYDHTAQGCRHKTRNAGVWKKCRCTWAYANSPHNRQPDPPEPPPYWATLDGQRERWI